MINEEVNYGSIVDGKVVKSKECMFVVQNLKQEQLEKIVLTYAKTGTLANISDLGWINPKNIINYYCHKCNKNYEESPKIEISIQEKYLSLIDSIMGYIYCTHCNDFLSIILIEKNESFDKSLITFDDTGKYIPYTKKFIDEKIDHEINTFNLRINNILNMNEKINEWIKKAKNINYEINQKKIYEMLKDSSISDLISNMDENYIPDIDLSYTTLKKILKQRKNSNELLKELEKKYSYFSKNREKLMEKRKEIKLS
jgi:hypothetical protein